MRAAFAVALWLGGLAAIAAAQEPMPPVPPVAEEPASAAGEDAAEAPPGTEPDAAAAPAVEPGPDRISFELPIPAERGGGRISGVADRMETTADESATLEGNVELKYRDVTVRAARMTFHRQTMTVEAEGDVIFDQGSRRIAAARVDFDLATRTGTFWNASAYVEPDYYFTGDVLAKTGENEYEIRDGIFTTCTGDEVPDWSLRTSRADVEIGGYARARNARVRAKRLPLLYWPYMLWPARTDRTSGLLIPNIGYSDRRGGYLGLAYYQVLGPSADATFYLDGYSKGFAGAGSEFRYRPSEGTQGEAEVYFLRDSDRDGEEWRARFDHTTTDLPWGLRGVVDYEDYSDYDFFRQFERAERQNTRRFLYSNAFLSGSWGAQSVNVLVDQRETFLNNGRVTTQRQLPDLNYRINKLKLGASDLYLSVDTTGTMIQSSSEGGHDESWNRFDLSPELTYPLRIAPWLSVAMSAAGRATWWEATAPVARIDPETGENALFCGDTRVEAGTFRCDESLDRVVPQAAVDVIGPSLSRIFDAQVGRYGKFKHLIEPRLRWRYSGEFDDQFRVLRFDEIDAFDENNYAEVALVNRVLAKPSDPTEGGAFEMLSFELAQAYSLDDEEPFQSTRDGSREMSEGPIRATLRLNPTADFSLQAKANWGTLFDRLDSTSLSARGNIGKAFFDLTWFTRYNAELQTTTSDQVRLGTRFDIVPRRLKFTGQVSYDIENSEVQQQRYFLTWTSQCWSAMIEASEQRTSLYESRDYRFMLNLKNVGTFLDLSSGGSDDE